ncbi:hypothetical protein PPYR_03227 [Photinus pyralis]|uniref:Transmembrane protein 53 n=1 Tax=Photinus pyralis TaxID=7054 RepID=A0A1Y1LSV1_PHOPY|nr:transmembrane protein 53-A isoform X2 [Photinus pyralis]KAB0791427.1 hypothetical protein PPYR_03227 [Photinus pyralis]
MAEEQDTLEYYIRFPSPSQQSANFSQEKTPIVILFGWAGCQDRYLRKYSQLYEEWGLITLRYCAPVKFILWKRNELRKIGERIVKLLVDMNFESHPVVVHCFSNGGAFLYHNFVLALRHAPKPIKVKGVIFDSGPGPRRFVSLYRAISAIISGNVIYNFVIAALLTSFLIVVWECEILKSYFVNDDYQSDPIEYLKIEDNKCPQYFIYSKADKLIFYEDVENFINIRRNNGVDVSVLTFDDSPHVKHYAHYKNEYSEGVNNFLVGCLKN